LFFLEAQDTEQKRFFLYRDGLFRWLKATGISPPHVSHFLSLMGIGLSFLDPILVKGRAKIHGKL
jgi:hypothetical protein